MTDISVKGLVKAFDQERNILDGLDLDVTAGEHIGSLSCSTVSGLLSPRITFEVGFRADRMVVARCASNVCSLNCSFAQLVKMAFSGSVLSAGAHYVFWGEK